jgi:hypothetical protein
MKNKEQIVQESNRNLFDKINRKLIEILSVSTNTLHEMKITGINKNLTIWDTIEKQF